MSTLKVHAQVVALDFRSPFVTRPGRDWSQTYWVSDSEREVMSRLKPRKVLASNDTTECIS